MLGGFRFEDMRDAERFGTQERAFRLEAALALDLCDYQREHPLDHQQLSLDFQAQFVQIVLAGPPCALLKH